MNSLHQQWESDLALEKHLTELSLATLKSVESFNDALEEIFQFLANIISHKEHYFFQQISDRLTLFQALSSVKITKSIEHSFTPLAEECLIKGSILIANKNLFLPLFFHEKQGEHSVHPEEYLPLGVIVLTKIDAIFYEKNSSFFERFQKMASGILFQIWRREKFSQERERISLDLISSKQSLTKAKRTIEFQYRYRKIIGGRAPSMKRLFEVLDRIIPTRSSIVLTGEPGTGKELIAKTIHELGPLSEKAFVYIDCANLNNDLIESELFGHKKGSFTGATDQRDGLLKKADGGTVFFDQIHSLPMNIQAKLLRAIQEGEIQSVGSSQLIKTNFRVISSSPFPLEQLVEKDIFRKDLYFRLNVISIQVPSLRERKEDIPILVHDFLSNFQGKKFHIEPEALKRLTNAPWNGNIPELYNTLGKICSALKRQKINLQDIPNNLQEDSSSQECSTLALEKSDYIRGYLKNLLKHCGGNVPDACKIAKMDRSSFYRLLRKYVD